MTEKENYTWESGLLNPNSYRKLVHILLSDLSYVQALAEVVDPADCDKLAQALVNIGTRADIMLPMIRAVLYCEFSGTKHAETVLRAGSCATKMIANFVKRVGLDYLRSLLEPLIRPFVDDPDTALEVDPGKMKDCSETALWVARQRLMEVALQFFERLSAPASIASMPREIRSVASYIADLSRRFFPSDMLPHIGGFIWLRFFNPAILAPEAYGILSAPPTAAARRSLILVTKLLQNLANGVEFDGLKEEYMVPLNVFITTHQRRMNDYLLAVATRAADCEIDSDGPVETAVASFVSESLKPRDFDLQDLVTVHRCLDRQSAKVLVRLQTLQIERDSTASSLFSKDSQFFDILKELGPSPPRLGSKAPASSRAVSVQDRVELLMDRSISNILEHGHEIDTARVDQLRVFYSGAPSLAGRPVFYFVAGRLRGDLVLQLDLLTVHVIKTLGPHLVARFDLVVDMSWACITPELRRRVFAQLESMHRMFAKKHRKMLSAVYILHPSSYTRSVLAFLREIASVKFFAKVQEVFSIEELYRYIAPDALRLVPETRNFITQSYAVEASTSKGRTRNWLLKLTTDSILVIDGRSNSIVKERLLTDIQSISAAPVSARLNIKFVPGTPPAKPLGFFPSRKASRGLAESYRLSFGSPQERDAMIEEVVANRHKFDGCFPQAYRISKSGKLRRSELTCKLTADGVLFLEGTKIRSETHFAGLERVWLDPVDPTVVWMLYKAETEPKQWQCDQALELVAALKEGMLRFKTESEQPFEDAYEDIYAEPGSGGRERGLSVSFA